MTRGLAFVLLLWACAIMAATAPPHASPPPSKIESGGTKATAPAATVPADKAPKAPPETEAHQSDHKPSQEARIADATVALAVITGTLAFFTALLWYATYALAKDARANGERQATETKAALTIARDTANAAARSAQLARDEFIASHRPRLKLREAYAIYGENGAEVVVRFAIANVGNSRATVVESALDVQYETPDKFSFDPIFLPASAGKNDIGPVAIEAGAHHVGDVRSSRETVWPMPGGSLNLCLSGHIVYQDERGVMRHLGIRRWYDHVSCRFGRRDEESDQLDYQD